LSLPIRTLSKAVREEGIDGWLFYGFKHRDPLADELLSIPAAQVNSRRWFYLVRTQPKDNVRICHTIENHALDSLPGSLKTYSSIKELKYLLQEFSGKRLAVQYSLNLPIFSYLDLGTAELLRECGAFLLSSGNLIQKVKGVLTSEGIASHLRAASHLREIVELCAQKISNTVLLGKTLYEGDVQSWILAEFAERKLVTDHPPIVACGHHSADPHYSPEGRGDLIIGNRVLQLDLWAKEGVKDQSIYADISWVFYTGAVIPEAVAKVFDAVTCARDAVIQFLNRELPERTISGSEADQVSRRVLIEKGFKDFIRHRTGHGIDSLPHGYGVNLDSIEFPDTRPFMQGSCFSVEPGLYLKDFGMRTEINIYIDNKHAVVTGGPIQTEIRTLGMA
jgi:Xaa-Pro aminopeptidase